ncbi:glucosyltransferase domain-containing protein [Allofournierella sp.]|uniref:glucosyltransferase domain-containing protein n=1 Tax=Allofournierella sp. TaxID=1940256 RepID=UPI003AF0C857
MRIHVNMGHLQPENVARSIKTRLKPEWVCAFWSTVAAGLLIHFYRLANYITVDDTPYFSYSPQDTSELGRWFLQWAGAISSYMELPALNSLLAIFYLSLFAVLVVELFEIRHKFYATLVGGILASLPAFTTTLMFGYAADPYMLAMLMAGVAVLCADRAPLMQGIVLGSLLLGLSMAIYQAYIDVAAVLCISSLLFAILKEKREQFWRKIALLLLRFVCIGVGGILFYIVGTKMVLGIKGVVASDYGGFSTMGGINFKGSLNVLYQIYLSPRHIFMDEFCYADRAMWQLLGWLAILTIIGLALRQTAKSGLRPHHWSRISAVLLCVALLPAAAHLLAIAQPHIFPYNSLNAFASGILWVVLLALIAKQEKPGIVTTLLRWFALVVVALSIWHFILIAQQCYKVARIVTERDMAVGNRVLMRMEEIEGYDLEGKVWFSGIVVPTESTTGLMQQAEKLRVNMRGLHTDTLLYGDNAYHIWMNEILGTAFQFATAEEKQRIAQTPEYGAMPPWPEEGCVKMIDDVLVVRLQE